MKKVTRQEMIEKIIQELDGFQLDFILTQYFSKETDLHLEERYKEALSKEKR